MLLAHDPVHAFMPYPAVAVESRASGPLAALSFGVKDLFDVAGYRTGCGSPVKLAESTVATLHAPAVQMLLDAGALFLGKTHTEELAWSLYGTNVHFGTPVNPAAPERVPGGSSSGSASAVAARLCDFALGSDTGGSVRAPASFCGLYGLRPTHGAIPLGGCMALAPSLDTAGFFARSATMMREIGAVLLPPSGARTERPLIAADLFDRLAPEAAAALSPMIERFEAALGKAERITAYPMPVDDVYAAFRIIQAHEAWQVHGTWFEARRPTLAPAIADRFAYAKSVSDTDLDQARALRSVFAAMIAERLAEGAVMLAPVLPGPAPRLASSAAEFDAYRHAAMAFLCLAGMAGIPQLVLPAGHVEGAPVGIALIGGKGSDRALLDLAVRLAGG